MLKIFDSVYERRSAVLFLCIFYNFICSKLSKTFQLCILGIVKLLFVKKSNNYIVFMCVFNFKGLNTEYKYYNFTFCFAMMN